MPITDFLLKAKESDHANQQKLAFATEHMLRKILEGLGLNIKEDTTAEQIKAQMKLARIFVVHIIDEPGKPKNDRVPEGFFFYRQDFFGKTKKLVHILKEPYFDKESRIVIDQGRVE